MASLGTQLRRGLVVFSLFAARWASADPSTSPTMAVGFGTFDGTLPEGRTLTLTPRLVITTPTPATTECTDDFAGEGCGGGKECGSYQTVTHDPTTRESPTASVDASCEGCTVTVAHEAPFTIALTGTKKDTTAHLHIVVKDAAGNSATDDRALEVTSDTMRVVRSSDTIQSPGDVFVPGQRFMWCPIGPTKTTPLTGTVETSGSVTTDVLYGYDGGCHVFATTDVGIGTILFKTDDGREATVDVPVVSPLAVKDLAFFEFSSPSYYGGYTANPNDVLATWPMQPTLRVEGNRECPYTPDVHVRFTTADGRFGLVPDSVLGKAPEYLTPWTVTYGGVTKTWELEHVADCDARDQ